VSSREEKKTKALEAESRSGFVALVGRPNVGKSTLLNQLLGEKVAIVTPKPQTTRNQIKGIRTLPNAQIVFLDTPGIHRARSLLNRRMVEVALRTLREVDVAVWVVDAKVGIVHEDEDVARALAGARSLVALNKIDAVAKPRLLPLMERCTALSPGAEILPVSALRGDNIARLLDAIVGMLPRGPFYYPGGEITDQTERFLASEIVREQIFLKTRQEIPYAVAVTIDEFVEREEKGLVVIRATIHAERESHKPILIGKKGLLLKEIGTAARSELERLFGCKIFLGLFVKIQPGWTQNPRALDEMGL
jgi:GTP-binding protein Era